MPRVGRGRPKQMLVRIIADRGYDSEPLWRRLRQRQIDLIAPHRRHRRRDTRYQDGRKLRRYRPRWIIERTNAWLLSFRRLAVRYDHTLAHYQAFLYAACLLITLRWF